MIKFKTPVNLNGTELVKELTDAGIISTDLPFQDGNGDLWLAIDAADETAAKAIVAAHNGTTLVPELTVEDKLASVGLNLNDLKAALGL